MNQIERRCRDNLSQLGRTLRERAHDPKWRADLLLREMARVAKDWTEQLDKAAKPSAHYESSPPTPSGAGDRAAEVGGGARREMRS